LASKYAILGQSDNSINLAVGSVGVNVYVNNTEWRGKEKVGELVQKLLDLAAIAAWPRVDAE
jgi:hypothetical protein